MQRNELEKYLNKMLELESIKDYCPNGLQIEGKNEINKLVIAVSLNEEIIELAVKKQADAILVHHGFFWNNENRTITSHKKRRIQKILANNINLFSYHLPLDVHPTFGNNIQLAKLLDLTNIKASEKFNPFGILYKGETKKETSIENFKELLADKLEKRPLVLNNNPRVHKIALITGAGQNYIDQVLNCEIDTFITGEVSEKVFHIALDEKINFISLGHHASERYGVKAIAKHLEEKFNLPYEYLEIDNPI